MEWEAATGKSYLTAGMTEAQIAGGKETMGIMDASIRRDKQYRAAKRDLANIPAAMMTAEERQGLQDTVTDYEKGATPKTKDLEQYKQDVVLGILGKRGLPFDPVQISKMKKAMVVTETDGGYKSSLGGGFIQNRYMTDSEMKGMNELVQKLMKEQGLSYSSIAMGPESTEISPLGASISNSTTSSSQDCRTKPRSVCSSCSSRTRR